MTLTISAISKLVRQSEKAAKIAVRNRFLIETYLSVQEAFSGKTRSHKSANALFRTLGI